FRHKLADLEFPSFLAVQPLSHEQFSQATKLLKDQLSGFEGQNYSEYARKYLSTQSRNVT
ncbi:MAG: hypothetical protein JW963_07320, partial [Anaerolineales bacterium]|nr:hypothetical protein [Anaerolineales bacterium]